MQKKRSTFWKIVIVQHVLIVLFLISGYLAAPFLDNEIERVTYATGKCAELAFPLNFHCANHWWILPVDRILFLPGFLSVLLWPMTALFAFVVYHKDNEHKFQKPADPKQ